MEPGHGLPGGDQPHLHTDYVVPQLVDPTADGTSPSRRGTTVKRK